MTPTSSSVPPNADAVPSRRPRWRARAFALAAVSLSLVAAVVVAVLLVAGVGRGDMARPASASEDGGLPISVGASLASAGATPTASPAARVELYTDYTDPGSARFASVNALVIQGLVRQGTIAVRVHPVVVGDTPQARAESLRAGNAVACVGEYAPASLWAYHVVLLALQPSDAEEALGDGDLIALARDTGVSDLGAVSSCIESSRYSAWIETESSQAASTGVGVHGVQLERMPTVLANGVPYEGRVDSSDEFRAFLTQAARSDGSA